MIIWQLFIRLKNTDVALIDDMIASYWTTNIDVALIDDVALTDDVSLTDDVLQSIRACHVAQS